MVRFHFLPMENSKKKMIAVLERILAQPNFASVAFVDAYRTAIRPEFGRDFFSTNRLNFVMQGCQQLNVGSGTAYELRAYPAGTVLVMKPYCLTKNFWGTEGRELFGIVVRPEYLRVLYSNNLEDGQPVLDPDYYYHISDSVRACTLEAIATLCAMEPGPEADRFVAPLMTVVCAMVLQDLKNAGEQEDGRAYDLWGRILEYLSSLPPERKNRREVARHFRVTEGYVSKLFSRYSATSFTKYVRSEALNKACAMLRETNLTVKEIADSCGFCTASHFIRTFRAAYHLSPAVWRMKTRRAPIF